MKEIIPKFGKEVSPELLENIKKAVINDFEVEKDRIISQKFEFKLKPKIDFKFKELNDLYDQLKQLSCNYIKSIHEEVTSEINQLFKERDYNDILKKIKSKRAFQKLEQVLCVTSKQYKEKFCVYIAQKENRHILKILKEICPAVPNPTP